jgi:hypothetical protein
MKAFGCITISDDSREERKTKEREGLWNASAD